MSDIKMPKNQKRRKAPKQKFASIPKQVPTNTTIIRTTYTSSALSSDTAGTISSSISASIQSASEYSVLSSLYREVRLKAQTLQFFWASPYNTGSQAYLVMMGTDLRYNGTTFTSPTQYLDIYNIADRKLFARTNPQLVTFRRQVPRDLEFSNIEADCPTLPVPFSGSPGVIQVYATNAPVSTAATTTIVVTATYELRGRI